MQAVCLQCKKTIPYLTSDDEGIYICTCGTEISYSKSIYRFVESDTFYEGRFTRTVGDDIPGTIFLKKVLSFISIVGNEDRAWRKAIKIIGDLGQLKILNIGCGGGHYFLRELGEVTCVDISFSSLMEARKSADYFYQADAANLPFPDECFDLVFSSHLLGHIPLQDKQKVIHEIYRVTKQNGYSLHSCECEADNCIYRRAKAFENLYSKYFIEMYGHYGLELPSKTMLRFHSAGFKPVFEKYDYCKGIIRPIDSYKLFFGNEFAHKGKIFKILACVSQAGSNNKVVKHSMNILLYPFTFINRFFGKDSVDSIKVLYKK